MITVPLKLLPSDSPQRPPAGWFVAGDDSRAWLEELLTWGVPAAAVRVFVVPRSAVERHAAGALITVEGEHAPRVGPEAHAYGCIAGRLYVPVEARLVPAATEEELAEALPDADKTYVWHPQAGLIGFEPGDIRSVRDLLAVPPRRHTAWDRAVPGVALNTRLISLEPAEPPTLESILAAGRDEIGSQSDELDELPPLPDEKRRGLLGRLADAAKRGMARVVKGLSGMAPQSGRGPGWLDRAGQWAQRVLSQPLLDEREKELRRLIQMLMNRPDEGLRYAIPMAGGDGHRGRGRPGARLMERDVNFDLGHLQGGGAADPWAIPPELQQQLAARYRELANREMQLGRHRRAAYIFARLLGDLNSAASALVSGRHFREAAVLYRDRLHRPFDAARCLEQGGLWSEATEMYLKLEAFEPAGDLFTRMEQPEDAADAYGRAVDAARRRGDHLKAAQLLEMKLDDPDGALVVLDEGWPHSGQAPACLDESFRLLGRHGRTEAARAKMIALRDSAVTSSEREWIVNSLVTAAVSYPDALLRPEAEDLARAVAAPALGRGSPEAARPFLKSLRRLVPFDRLHGRDIDRFEQSLIERRAAPPPVRLKYSSLRPVREIRLPQGVDWQAAASNNDGFYAAGFSGSQLLLVRGLWREDPGRIDRVVWSGDRSVRPAPILLAADEAEGQSVLIGLRGRPALPKRYFVRRDVAPTITSAATPLMSEQDRLGFAQSAAGGVYCIGVGNESRLVVYTCASDGVLISASTFGPDELLFEPDELTIPLPVHARAEGVYFGFGRHLVSVTNRPRSIREMRGPIRGLAGSGPHTRFRLALAFDRGVGVMWDGRERSLAWCAEDVENPALCMTTSGALVVCGDWRCEIYSTSSGSMKLNATGSVGPRPVALLTTNRPDQFAVCLANGVLRVYEFATERS